MLRSKHLLRHSEFIKCKVKVTTCLRCLISIKYATVLVSESFRLLFSCREITRLNSKIDCDNSLEQTIRVSSNIITIVYMNRYILVIRIQAILFKTTLEIIECVDFSCKVRCMITYVLQFTVLLHIKRTQSLCPIPGHGIVI